MFLLLASEGFPGGSDGKESACNVGYLGLIPGLAISPGEGKGYPLQYSGQENSMDYPRGQKQSDTTEWLSLHFHLRILFFVCVSHHLACRILASAPGIETGPLIVKEWSLTTGLSGESTWGHSWLITLSSNLRFSKPSIILKPSIAFYHVYSNTVFFRLIYLC